MNGFLGRKLAIGIKEEAQRGVAENTPAVFLPLSGTPSLDDVVEKMVNENSGGTNFEGVGDRISKVFSEGKLSGDIGADSIAYLFKGVFGKVSTANNGDGTYTHTFEFETQNTHPSFTFFKYDPVQGYKYPGVMFGSLVLSASDRVVYEVDVKGKKGVEASITPAFTEEPDFAVGHASVKYANSVNDLDGASPICVRDIKIEINKNLIEDQCLGEVSIKPPVEGVIAISGEFNAVYDKKDYHDDLLNDQKRALRFSLLNSGETIGSGSRHPEIVVDLYNVKLQGTPIAYNNSDLAMVNVQFKGYLDLASGKAMVAKVVNELSSV